MAIQTLIFEQKGGEEMQSDMERVNGVTLIKLESDISNNQRLSAMISPVLEKCNKLVFDMEQVRFIDSRGCGRLLTCIRKLKQSGGELKLCRVQKPIQTLFELLRLHRIIEIFNTREEAVRSFAD